jgi:hypothetical protein
MLGTITNVGTAQIASTPTVWLVHISDEDEHACRCFETREAAKAWMDQVYAALADDADIKLPPETEDWSPVGVLEAIYGICLTLEEIQIETTAVALRTSTYHGALEWARHREKRMVPVPSADELTS